MAQTRYNIENVYKEINTINGYFGEGDGGYGGTVEFTYGEIHDYCDYRDNPGKYKCQNYLENASSGVIYVLKKLKDNYDLEYDKLAEYAILWLRYKLNQKKPYNNTKLNDFYTNHIEKNRYYNHKIKGDASLTYKEIINTKKELMYIKEMTKFSYPFKLLLLLYDKNNKKSGNCDHLDKAKIFAKEFEKLSNDSNNKEGSSYNKLLYRLSDDYGNLKKKCDNFPSLPELTPQKIPVQPTALSPEATSSSSSISTTLIPALSIVSVIPVFLGISYKYSLFGIDKLFQRQYLRTKLKNVKKKMKLNI
ncbi:PIR protein CIR protein [Plasmodium vinckei brucechwatti]|uniref:PIR protein CIR protein n=1 Tax=Plasmodium vinckei brucechwatti TaxID=119398 RepID=A0A6V7S2J1_PLAVN|nr:PIR protein CIR protein [Plasmodium vinckei brucechwatti]